MLLASVLNHLAAHCSTSSVPGFWGVCCRYHCAPELWTHLKTHNQENPFYFLIWDCSHLFLHCSVHLMFMQREACGGGKTYYLQAFSNLKKVVQIYFFKWTTSTDATWIASERVGCVYSEVLLEKSAETILHFFFYFHIHVSKSCFHLSFNRSEMPRYLLSLPFKYLVLPGLKNGPV